jgi:hypothetical protein
MTTALHRFFLALAFVLAIGAAAEAGPINLIGGTAGTIPGGASNDFIPGHFPGPQIGGYYGTQVEVVAAGPSTLLFEFFGAEAGYHNEFNVSAIERFDHPGGTIISPNLASPLASYSMDVIGTFVVPFSFEIDGDAGSVANGSNPDDSAGQALGPNFFASCDPFGTSAGSGGRSCSSLYLFLDDGGAGPDDNHDDFVVRMTVTSTSVAEPGTLGLLGLGLVMLRRRQR